MAAESFNSLGGYSIGIPPTSVINASGGATFNYITISGQTALGSVGNVHILGGENGYFLQTDGTGNLTWAAGGNGGGGNGIPGGANSQVQFNDNGNFAGDAGFTYDKVNNVLAVTGNIVSYEYIASGNITAGNANLGNVVVANYFSGDGSLLTGVARATSAASVANGSSNITIPAINGNATVSVSGNANVLVVTNTGLVSSNLTITGNSTFSNIAITQKFNSNQASNVNLGNVANLHIDGGVNGYFLQTDGAGNLIWAAGGGGGGGVPGGLNTQIQYNDNGNFGGSSSLTFNEVGNIVTANNFNVGNVIVSTSSNLGSVSNIIITGGSSGYFLQTNGSGVLTWAPPVAVATISNGTSNLNIATANGNVTASVNGVSNILVISSTGLNVTGNIVNSGNTVTSGNATVTGNITSTAGTLVLDTGVIVVSGTDAGIFNTTISNINIGLAANVTLGSPGGNVTARGNLIANNFRTTGNLVVESTATITNLKVSEISSNRTPVSVTVGTVIDSFSVNKYRSAKYTMRVNSDDGYQAVEVLLIHDNTNSYVTIYGSLSTIGTDIIVLSTDIVSGNVRMLATTASTNTTVNLLGVYVAD